MLKAGYEKKKTIYGFQEIELEPGQFIFGRKKAAEDTGLTERSIRTCLKLLEKSGNVTIETTNKFSIITVVNWGLYQDNQLENDQQNDQQVTSKRPTSDQQVTTNKNNKNVRKKEKNIYTAQAREILESLNFKTGKKFKPVPSHLEVITARLKEGFTMDDCKRVIDIKTSKWLHTEQDMYLRPKTLFSADNFDSYLNEREHPKKNTVNNRTISKDFSVEEQIERSQ